MDRLFKRLFFLLLGLVALVVLVAVVVSWQVGRQFTPEKFVAILEKNLNCRATASACEASLWSFPARLEVKDFAMGKRDDAADNAVPLAERVDRMEPGQQVISVDSVVLSIDLVDLLRGKLDFKELKLVNLDAHIVDPEEGENSFEEMFSKPEIVEGEANPEFREKEKKDDDEKEPAKPRTDDLPDEEEGKRGFGVYARDLKLPASLDRLEIVSGDIRIDNLEKGRITRFEDGNLVLTHVQVDPKNLEEVNHCFADIDTRFLLEDLATGKATLDVNARGAGGEMIPFDPENGELNPHILIQIDVSAGSRIDGHPILSGFGHAIEAAKDLGLSFAESWDSSVELSKPTSGLIRYRNEIIVFEEDVVLPVGVYGLGVTKGSWIDPELDSHFVDGNLTLSADATTEAFGKIEGMLASRFGEGFGKGPLEKTKQKLLDGQKRMRLGFLARQRGEESDVDVQNPLSELIRDILKEKGGVEGLLRGLLE